MYGAFAKTITLTGLLIIVIVFSVNPQSTPLKPNLTFSTAMAALGSIFIIVLLVERVTEIIISIWRQSEADVITTEIEALKTDTTKATDLLSAQKKLTAYRSETKSIALLVGFSVSVVVCAAGIGLLSSVIDITDHNTGLLRGVDIILTSGLIAGGSDGFHQFVSSLEAFLTESKKRIESRTKRDTPVAREFTISPMSCIVTIQ